MDLFHLLHIYNVRLVMITAMHYILNYSIFFLYLIWEMLITFWYICKRQSHSVYLRLGKSCKSEQSDQPQTSKINEILINHLSISEEEISYLLGFSHTKVSRVYIEWCKKQITWCKVVGLWEETPCWQEMRGSQTGYDRKNKYSLFTTMVKRKG